jgi:hypothetical protein
MRRMMFRDGVNCGCRQKRVTPTSMQTKTARRVARRHCEAEAENSSREQQKKPPISAFAARP